MIITTKGETNNRGISGFVLYVKVQALLALVISTASSCLELGVQLCRDAK